MHIIIRRIRTVTWLSFTFLVLLNCRKLRVTEILLCFSQANLTIYQTHHRMHRNATSNNKPCHNNPRAVKLLLYHFKDRFFSSHLLLCYERNKQAIRRRDQQLLASSQSRESNSFRCNLYTQVPKFTRCNNLAKFKSNLIQNVYQNGEGDRGVLYLYEWWS